MEKYTKLLLITKIGYKIKGGIFHCNFNLNNIIMKNIDLSHLALVKEELEASTETLTAQDVVHITA